MSLKVFDFVCKSKKCKGSQVEERLKDFLIDLEKEPAPKCPLCGGEMELHVGTAFVPHVSWSKWRV